MNNKKPQNQVSLAGVAKQTNKPAKEKKPFAWKWVVIALVAVVIGILVWVLMSGEEEGPSLTAREMVEYTVTPDDISDKVSYFALGVTGATPTDTMDMVAVMCYNREEESATVMQVPVATYIGKDNGFAVSTIGGVWGNPAPETFCSTCRIRLEAEEIADGTHKTCGSEIELRSGSSHGDLIRVFNEQYGLPIDNFLVIPREGLIELIDRLGGVNISLAKNMKLADVNYEKGVQLLDGAAAVDYAVTDGYKDTVEGDLTRMGRQRQVFTAVWQRLGRCEAEDLYDVDDNTDAALGVFGKLMLGANPVRFNTTSFGKARLLDISEGSAGGMKLSESIAIFAEEIGDLSLDKVTFTVLPGISYKEGTTAVYSADTSSVIALLNGMMNPFGLPIDDTTVLAPQLKEAGEKEPVRVTLDTLAVEQSEPQSPEAEASDAAAEEAE